MFAREPLWKIGLDYRHGTGHGIGHFLNVHEGTNTHLRGGNEGYMTGRLCARSDEMEPFNSSSAAKHRLLSAPVSLTFPSSKVT